MRPKTILLVEDNPDDVELTLQALKRNTIANEITVVHDGVEALDFLFGEGKFATRDLSTMPTVVLLDLMLPKVDARPASHRGCPRPVSGANPMPEVAGPHPQGCNRAAGAPGRVPTNGKSVP